MHPLMRLGLPDAKQKALNFLRRVQPKIHQDEQQLIPTVLQLRFAPTAIASCPRCLDVMLLQVLPPPRSKLTHNCSNSSTLIPVRLCRTRGLF